MKKHGKNPKKLKSKYIYIVYIKSILYYDGLIGGFFFRGKKF